MSFSTPKSAPRLSPTIIASFTPYSAVVTSNIILDGGNPITERGVCWSTKQNPKIKDNKIINNSSSNSFETIIPKLNPSSTYYVRSYAINSIGESYGQEIMLKTLDIKLPIPDPNCTAPASISYDFASLNINIVNDGLSNNLETGIIFSTSSNVIDLTYNNLSSQTLKSTLTTLGKILIVLNNLKVNTKYNYVTYAKNEAGISYGPVCSFTTLDYTAPVISQNCISTSNIGTNVATITGDVLSDGGITKIEKGFVFGINNQNLTYQNANSQTVISTETVKGQYSFVLTKLKAKTKYYYKAFSKNTKGISYGSQCEFTTNDYGAPKVNSGCLNETDITRATAKIYGNVSDDGGDVNLEKGFVYGTSTSLNYGVNTLKSSEKGIGAFNYFITNLSPGTRYYYKSYAINETGKLVYGPLCDFTTNLYDMPVVNSDCLSPTTDFTSATVRGNLISWGGADFIYSSIEKGVIWSINSSDISANNPTGTRIMAGFGSGDFSVSIPNLNNGTIYYYRVYAKNSAGVTIGPVCSFVTKKYSIPEFNQTCIDANVQIKNVGLNASLKSNDPVILSYGFLFSQSQSPSILDINNKNTSRIAGRLSSSTLSANLLEINTEIFDYPFYKTFYYRAYMTNSAGTGYGPICSFSTLPIVETKKVSNLLSSSVTLNGSIINNGGYAISGYGFSWSTSSDFSTGFLSSYVSSNNLPFFSLKLNIPLNIPAKSKIYYRVFATNFSGSSIGNVESFISP